MVPESKEVIQILTTALTNGGTECGSGDTSYMDTLAYDYALIDVTMSPPNNATNNPSEFNLLEADVTTSSSFATVSGFRGDTDWTIATMSTSLPSTFRFGVDLRGRKRYLKVSVIPITSHVAGCLIRANLFKPEQSPVTATKAGVVNLVNG